MNTCQGHSVRNRNQKGRDRYDLATALCDVVFLFSVCVCFGYGVIVEHEMDVV